MNILFLSLIDIQNMNARGIYQDLLNTLAEKDHNVFIVSPFQRRTGGVAGLIRVSEKVSILRVKIGNTTKTNAVEKGISTLTLESILRRAIKKHFSHIRFDLILYPTPPVTFCGAVSYVKKRDRAVTYLMLKDIFPQNSLDLQMLSKKGLKGLIYRMFRKKEKKLYAVSDHIGCMSPANIRYLMEHEAELTASKLCLCPNAITVRDVRVTPEERITLLKKYGLPLDRKILLYGGNVGKPQDAGFILRCLEQIKDRRDICVLIMGSGTEFGRLQKYQQMSGQENFILHQQIPAEEYEKLCACCDVGLIFLDHRFTIPNVPSRILPYLQAAIPVLTATDAATDLPTIVTDNGFGLSCSSADEKEFVQTLDRLLASDLKAMGEKGREYLLREYDVRNVCDGILQRIENGVQV